MLQTFSTRSEAHQYSQDRALVYSGSSRWEWQNLSGRLFSQPHPKLPCLLDPSVARRGNGWVPCWVLFAGRDQPGWRFYQWTSARNDATTPLPLEDAAEVLEHIIGDYVFLIDIDENQ